MGFDLTDLFKAQVDLDKQFVINNSSKDLEFDLEAIEKLKEQFLQKAQTVDKSLSSPIEGEFKKINKGLENLQNKFTRALKRNSETQLNQIAKTKAKIYPSQKLQGRYVNFLEIYSKYGTDFFDVLLNSLNKNLTSNCWIFEK